MRYKNSLMGATKIDLFTSDQNQLAMIAKSLAHPARIAIIEHLLKVNKCICSEFVEEFKLAQPTISQHLKELKSAGLIQGNIEGASVCYCLNKSAIHSLQTFLSGISK